MNIYIPSKSRANLQRTFLRLPTELREKTKIVVPPEDVYDYENMWGSDRVLSCPLKGIAPTRNYIMNYAKGAGNKKVVQLDDDLTFQRFRDNGRITNNSLAETAEAFDWLSLALDLYTHAGFSVRFSDKGGGQEDKSPSRMMHVLGYNLSKIPEGVGFLTGVDDPEHYSMDDFNMTLQLLTQGHANVVSSEWRTSPSPGNAKGGASTWRTLQTQNDSAHNLKRLFPDYVALRAKTNWQGIEGGQMYDVTVQWKKAYRGSR